jgi:hypothetical protein
VGEPDFPLLIALLPLPRTTSRLQAVGVGQLQARGLSAADITGGLVHRHQGQCRGERRPYPAAFGDPEEYQRGEYGRVLEAALAALSLPGVKQV